MPRGPRLARPVLIGGLVLGAVAGGVIASRRSYVALVGPNDVHAPPGYLPNSSLPLPDPSIVLLGSWASAPKCKLWVERAREPIGLSLFSMDRTLDAVEGGARAELAKAGVSFEAKREVRQIAGREVGLLELRMSDGGMLRVATVLVGRSQLSIGATVPLGDADRERASYEAVVDQVAHLQPQASSPNELYKAAGAGAGRGFLIALLPSIGLAALFRRRR